jgi:hypothetical protein
MPGTLPRLIQSANPSDTVEVQNTTLGLDIVSRYKLAPSTAATANPAGAWNYYEIIANGNNISVKLNGTPVAELQNGARRTKGFIALQNHHPGTKVQFRNIRIKG